MPSTEQVVYEMNLKDGLSPEVEKAAEHVKHLEEGLKGVGERLLHIAEAFGISFGLFKLTEFIHQSTEEWEKLEFANSQLEAGLESTEHAAGVTFEELSKGADEFSHNLKFSKAQVEDMQSILLTFTSVTKDTFQGASAAVLDMATRLKTDASSAALQLGKALQDPVAGLGALHRVGVNVDELRKKFVHVTDTLERQKLIIKELNEEFGGSAAAAAGADVTFRYNKAMEELKVTIGQVADKLLEYFTPALESMVETIKEAIDWGQRNKDLLKEIGEVLGILGTAWLTYKGILLGLIIVEQLKNFWDLVQIASLYTTTGAAGGLSTAMTILTAVQYGLNTAIAANPIGMIILALAAVGVAVYECWKHFAGFRAFLTATWYVLTEFANIVTDVFAGLGKIILGLIHFSPSEIAEGWQQSTGAIFDSGKRLANAAKSGWDEGMAGFENDHKSLIQPPDTVTKGLKAKKLGDGEKVKDPKAKGTGSKVITINVHITKMVGIENMQTTTVKDATGNMRKSLVDELASAVNDFQVTADH